jgi:hypothetical protein
MNINDVEDKYNVEGIAETIIEEMKEHGNGADDFDDYWYQIGLSLNSRGFARSEVKTLEGLVQKKVEILLGVAS